ncbi:MAG: sulfonate transport system substrate-binding protein [Acetobacteraceae bacterium]|nr:sulfonate transport system substrate-binding protein [Acetobacteraceae bacterium]
MNLSRRHLLTAGLSLPLGTLPRHRRADAADSKTLRVGFQKGEPVLMAARANKDLETLLAPNGISVEWVEFQFGLPMLEAMRVGGIDIGAVGDMPPIFAQAAHSNLRYIAGNLAAPHSILLPTGSRIQTVSDLKGKKLAFARGSSAHNFALMVLENSGLRYVEIEPVYLGPADAGAAFDRGATDAWSVWEPYASLLNNRPGVRTLTTNKEIGEQFGYIMGNGPFVRANSMLTASVVHALTVTAEKARGHHEAVSALLAGATGIQQDVWTRALAEDPFQVLPMNDELTRSQQKVADRFRALGLVPVDINVSDIVWREGV